MQCWNRNQNQNWDKFQTLLKHNTSHLWSYCWTRICQKWPSPASFGSGRSSVTISACRCCEDIFRCLRMSKVKVGSKDQQQVGNRQSWEAVLQLVAKIMAVLWQYSWQTCTNITSSHICHKFTYLKYVWHIYAIFNICMTLISFI